MLNYKYDHMIAYNDQLNKGPLPQTSCHPLNRQIHLVSGMEESFSSKEYSTKNQVNFLLNGWCLKL